jgi:hypothetical protein
MVMKQIKEALVVFINGILSRKFIAFAIGTAIFIFDASDKIKADHWLILVGIYVGANVIESMGNKYISGSTVNNGNGVVKDEEEKG